MGVTSAHRVPLRYSDKMGRFFGVVGWLGVVIIVHCRDVPNCAGRALLPKPIILNLWLTWIQKSRFISPAEFAVCLHKVTLRAALAFTKDYQGPGSYTLVSVCCERWPRHKASGVYLPRPISHPTGVWILYQPCDLYSGGVITHRAHRELKSIMRFVNKRQPYWQQLTHLPSSMVSFDRCVCTCVCARTGAWYVSVCINNKRR